MEDPRPKPRGDFPGAWHHVTNRGLAQRPAFEGRADVRSFLALLALKVRECQIEVHAFSILTTHFHLLLRSTRGELSDAMMWIENRYVKNFNRERGRDGSLFRSRFRSRIVDTEEYWWNVVRYIDRNAVDAGLCERSVEYEFGSARLHCRERGAPWLQREIIEQAVRDASRCSSFAPEAYEKLFGARLDPDDRWVIERRIEHGAANRHGEEQGNELLGLAPSYVVRWLRERALMADGGVLGYTFTAPGRVDRALRELAAADPGWSRRWAAKGTRGWIVLKVGMLRQLCGLSLQEIADREGIARSSAWLHFRRHGQWLAVDRLYAERAAEVIERIRSSHRAGFERGVPDVRRFEEPRRAGMFMMPGAGSRAG